MNYRCTNLHFLSVVIHKYGCEVDGVVTPFFRQMIHSKLEVFLASDLIGVQHHASH